MTLDTTVHEARPHMTIITAELGRRVCCPVVVLTMCLAVGWSGVLVGPARAETTSPAGGPSRALPAPETIAKIGTRVADWQLAQLPPGNDGFRGWIDSAFYTGLLKFADVTAEDKYFDATRREAEANGWRLGGRPRHADDQLVGYVYGLLYRRYGEPQIIAPVRAQFDWLASLPYDEPLTWQNNIADREWAWCDALFMAPATMWQLSAITGDPKYADQANRLWWKTSDYLFDPKENLFSRDGRYFDRREPNGSKVYWSRGNGWVVAGLVRVLENMPENDPRRERYVDLYRRMVRRLVSLQQPSGYWPAGLLDAQTWQQPESSGTAFYTYAIAWGINHGLLARAEYLPAVLKGWAALVKCVQPSGKIGWVQRVDDSPHSSGPDQTGAYATGGFLLAASEVYKLSLLSGATQVSLTGTNALDDLRLAETVEVPWSKLQPQLGTPPTDAVSVVDSQTGSILLSQITGDAAGKQPDMLLFQADFFPKQAKKFTIYRLKGHTAPRQISRVFGRAVPERLDDFAWESDRIAYRVYGPALAPLNDAGSGIDVWVKKVRYPIINKWYAGDDYHVDHGEGLDGYKVGKSRGAGGEGLLLGDKLYISGMYTKATRLAGGPLRVSFELEYGPWNTPAGKVKETKRISLDANRNLNHVTSWFTVDGNKAELPVAIGLELLGEGGETESGKHWLGYWGPQEGEYGRTGVGLVVTDRPFEIKRHSQTRRSGVGDNEFDETNEHVLAVTNVKPGEMFSYYVGAGWSKGPDFPSADAWFHHLAAAAARFGSPIEVTVEK